MTRLRAWQATALLADRAAIAFGLVVLGVYLVFSEPVRQSSPRALDGFAVFLLTTALAVLLVRRRYPATVSVTVVGLSILWYSVGYTSRLIDGPALVAFYTLGTTGQRLRELGVAGLAAAALLTGALAGEGNARAGIGGIGWVAAAILLGELVRGRRLLLEQYAERAATAEAERDAEAERRVADERLRIARDVHDVLAHTVSVMTVQAGVAADALDRDPEAVRPPWPRSARPDGRQRPRSGRRWRSCVTPRPPTPPPRRVWTGCRS